MAERVAEGVWRVRGGTLPRDERLPDRGARRRGDGVDAGIHGRPRVTHAAFTLDPDQARASIRKLAAMAPSAAWPGHAEALIPSRLRRRAQTGDVAAQLERAAAAA